MTSGSRDLIDPRLQGFILDSMREGVSVTDENGMIIYSNPAEDAMFGYDPGELVGQHVSVQNAYPAEENARIVGEVIAQLRAQGAWTGTWRNIRKDGTSFTTHARITALELDGRPHWVCVQEDITEHLRAEERKAFLDGAADVLARPLDEHRTLVDLTRYCLPFLADYCSIDLLTDAGDIRRVETAHVDPALEPVVRELWARYPYRADEPIGVPEVLRTGEPQFVPGFPSAEMEAFARDADHLRMLRQLGPRSYLSVPLVARGKAFGAISLVFSDSGRIYTEHDVAVAAELARRASAAVDNARLYDREQAANRAKSEFLATMSHELRTPINATIGYVELLTYELHGPLTDAQRLDLDRIKRSQQHLLGVITDILNFSRIEAGRVEYAVSEIVADEILAEACAMIEPQANARSITCSHLPAPTSLVISADRERVRQILLNLLSNAVKFTPNGGTIETRAEARGDAVAIRVRDSGVGIPDERRGSVFEPFVQLDQTLTRQQEGTGLGLSISRDLARGMGGDIVIEASAADAGTTMLLTLPRSGA